nr:VCBS repeat-containing protein [Geothrix paludis]
MLLALNLTCGGGGSTPGAGGGSVTVPPSSPAYPHFRTPQIFPTGSGPADVAVADLNQDGTPDLVTGEVNLGEGKGITCRLLRQSSGTLQSLSTQWQDTPQTPSTVGTADINGDGIPDIITVNESGSVSIWLNLTPKGSSALKLAPRVDIQLPAFPANGLAVGDLNKDGLPDLVVGHLYGLTTWVLMNQTVSGQTLAQFKVVEVPVSSTLWGGVPVLADLDGDGRLDLALPLGSNDPKLPTLIAVLINQTKAGDSLPTFNEPVGIVVPAFGTDLKAGDLDGDGRSDLVLCSRATSQLVILRNLTSSVGTPTFDVPYAINMGFLPTYLALADINRDGVLDVLTSDQGSDSITVLENRSVPGGLHFDNPIHWNTLRAPAGFRVADIDGDGWPDVMVAVHEQSTVAIIKNLGTKGGRILWDATLGIPAGAFPVAMQSFDMKQDGHPMVFVTDQGGDSINLIHFVGSDAAGLPLVESTTLPLGVQQPQGLALVDLDGDGAPDLATLSVLDQSLVICRNITPSGATSPQFGAPIKVSWPIAWPFGNGWTDISPYHSPILRAMDVNGDGRMDLVAACEADASVTVFLNLPTGFVAKRFEMPAGTTLWNADPVTWAGHPAGALMLTGQFFVNQTPAGAGEPSFVLSSQFYGSSSSGVRTPMDLNGDGFPDLLMSWGGALGGVLILNQDLTQPQCQWLTWTPWLSSRNTQSILVDDLLGTGTPSALVLDDDGYAQFYRNFWTGMKGQNGSDNLQKDIASGGGVDGFHSPSSQNILSVRLGASKRKCVLSLHSYEAKLSIMTIVD